LIKAKQVVPIFLAFAVVLLYGLCSWAMQIPDPAGEGEKELIIRDLQKRLNPRFKKEPRSSTRFIIVHTSEAGMESTLRTLSNGKKIGKRDFTVGGHAHYTIARDGQIYQVLSTLYRADHSGLSMWDGLEDISSHSIGIELVGYHYDEITAEQYYSLSWLIKKLQRVFRVTDRDVLAHSQVSYGNPNQWFKRPHRGRKRCALNFDRYRVGLLDAWSYDPDVKAGRLQADHLVAKMFYLRKKPPVQAASGTELLPPATVMPAMQVSNVVGSTNTAWNIAGEDFDSPETIYVLPGREMKTIRGDLIGKEIGWDKIPTGTQVMLNQPLDREKKEGPIFQVTKEYTAWSFAGANYRRPSTIYFLPGDTVVPGNAVRDWDSLPSGTRIIVGYQGPILVAAKEGKTPWGIAKKAYNQKETIYLIPGKSLVTGDLVQDFNNLPRGTQVFIKIDTKDQP